MVERVHRQIKDALRARGAGLEWHSHLPWVLLGLRAAPKEDSAVSSAELVLGTPLILPGQLVDVQEPPHVEMAPPPTQPTSYAAAADTAGAFGGIDLGLCTPWRPAQAAGGPVRRPLSCGEERSKDLQRQDRAEVGVHLCGQVEGPHRRGSGVSGDARPSRPA